MNKELFLKELRAKLSGLPQNDVEERILFYSEIIDDRIEDGLTEEEAILSVGNVDDIVEQIMSEIPLTKLVKEKVKPKKSLRTWEIVLLVLGFPVWFPLLIAFFAVILCIFIVLWAVVIVVYAVDFALAACAVLGVPGAILMLSSGKIAGAVFYLGAGILSAGLAILLFFACGWIARGILYLTRKMLLWIKRAFIGKGGIKNEER